MAHRRLLTHSYVSFFLFHSTVSLIVLSFILLMYIVDVGSNLQIIFVVSRNSERRDLDVGERATFGGCFHQMETQKEQMVRILRNVQGIRKYNMDTTRTVCD